MLWACDFNLVRGEDSLVRALWAGKPLVWHIYPQSDAAHHDKLNAFLEMLGADATLRQTHLRWNGLAPVVSTKPDANTDIRADADTRAFLPSGGLSTWGAAAAQTRTRLLQMDDLTTQLVNFVLKKR